MPDLQVPRIKNLKMFIIFVSMAMELLDHQKFYKNTAISKQIILLVQTKICIMYTHSGKSLLYNKIEKLKKKCNCLNIDYHGNQTIHGVVVFKVNFLLS